MRVRHPLIGRWFSCVALGMTWICVSGCSRGFHNAPVDGSKAIETLEAALESWKKGDEVDTLQSGSPPIYVIDMEWKGGAKLKDFEIMSDGDEKDAHLFCPVTLTFGGGGGKEVKKQVTYIISTAPNLTVARKVF
jgi:hypothetical protein